MTNKDMASGRAFVPAASDPQAVPPVPASIPDAAKGGMTPELRALLDKLAAKQLPPKERLERDMAVTRFIAGLNDSTRVFCRGAVYLEKGHFPAVLTYNAIYRQTIAWACSGKKNTMEGHHEAFFHSDIPHIGIAREVLMGPETAQGTSAGTAKTEGLGAQPAGPVPQECAQGDPHAPN